LLSSEIIRKLHHHCLPFFDPLRTHTDTRAKRINFTKTKKYLRTFTEQNMGKVAKEVTTGSSKRKTDNEIDEIFAAKKQKRELTKIENKKAVLEIPKQPRKVDRSNDTLFSDPRGVSSGVRKTDDGLKIIPAEDLKIGQGNGDSPECPFDCWCCY
jgi:hypothetical protein